VGLALEKVGNALSLIIEPNLCLIFCTASPGQVAPARLRRLLSGAGLDVAGAKLPLAIRDPGGTAFTLTVTRGAVVGTLAHRLLGRRRKYREALVGCDTQFEIRFADLDEVFSQALETLIEIQETLKDATRGVVYRSWNDTWSGPDD
jgi:hypothetical protein